jgi:hypothetical protein
MVDGPVCLQVGPAFTCSTPFFDLAGVGRPIAEVYEET